MADYMQLDGFAMRCKIIQLHNLPWKFRHLT